MTRTALIWAGALVVSAGLHSVAGYALYLATRPDDVPDQSVPTTELQLAAYQVQRSEARATAPQAEAAEAEDTVGAALEQGQIATSRANPRTPRAEKYAALAPLDTVIDPVAPGGAVAEPLPGPIDSVTAQDVAQTASGALALEPETRATAEQLDQPAPLPPRPQLAEVVDIISTPDAQNLAEIRPDPIAVPARIATDAVEISAQRPALARAHVQTPETETKTAIAPIALAATEAALRTDVTVAALQPAAQSAATTRMPANALVQMPVPQRAALEAAPETSALSQRPVAPETAAPVAPQVDRAKASLAFQRAGGGSVDPVSLTAFQSFMEPGDLDARASGVRDGITEALGAVPCSRLRVEFDPTETALLVSGHVPEAALRRDVVAAMQSRMGTDIAVRDNLLILPRPQCGALTGIADVGLPQSTDQITNPLLLGEDTHAREFSYTAGNPLVMELQGADYDAYVYVDYFDADGNVLHLRPNDFTPIELTKAKSALQIGSDRPLSPGMPGLYIEIGPPFGQEIAVAFAASHPLYDGVRPLIEPAAPYLDWLRDRVTAAREKHPDFKGEWVYFFVSTSPG